MLIYLGADHNGFHLKEKIKIYLKSKNYLTKDMGNTKFELRDDYPDFAKKVAKNIQKSKDSLGILFCGSGQGMCMSANRYKGIQAALTWSTAAAKKARQDDNANIICLPSKRLSDTQARRIVNAWLNTKFSGLARYKRRIKKMS